MTYPSIHFEVTQLLKGTAPERQCANEACTRKGGSRGDGILVVDHPGRDESRELAWYCSAVCAASRLIVQQASGDGWTRADILDHLAAAIAETPDADENADQIEFPPVDPNALKVGAGVRLGLTDTKPVA